MNHTHELTYLVKSEDDDSRVSELLSGAGAEIERADALRKIQLAYPIQREAFAFFGVMLFRADLDKIADLSAKLHSEGRILRFLITRATRSQPERKGDRAGREGRPSGKMSPDGRRSSSGQGFVQSLSNEALQEKIEEILQ